MSGIEAALYASKLDDLALSNMGVLMTFSRERLVSLLARAESVQNEAAAEMIEAALALHKEQPKETMP